METNVAPCGLDCAACPSFIATRNDDKAALAEVLKLWEKEFGFKGTVDSVRCTGCHSTSGVQIGNCAECGVRLCAIGKGYKTCAECPDYGCAKLSEFLKNAPDAKKRLDALRN